MKTTNKITLQVTIEAGKRKPLSVSAYARTQKAMFFNEKEYLQAKGLAQVVTDAVFDKLKELTTN